jgi:very-short-patch-repair endonuclease
MVAVELDGRLYHSSPEQHERDLRRDSALAAMGWGTIRFTHPRLRNEHSAVEELLRVLETRRRQLRIA